METNSPIYKLSASELEDSRKYIRMAVQGLPDDRTIEVVHTGYELGATTSMSQARMGLPIRDSDQRRWISLDVLLQVALEERPNIERKLDEAHQEIERLEKLARDLVAELRKAEDHYHEAYSEIESALHTLQRIDPEEVGSMAHGLHDDLGELENELRSR